MPPGVRWKASLPRITFQTPQQCVWRCSLHLLHPLFLRLTVPTPQQGAWGKGRAHSVTSWGVIGQDRKPVLCTLTAEWAVRRLVRSLGLMGQRGRIDPLSLQIKSKKKPVTTSGQFSRSVMLDSLRPHELQHARPPCPSPTLESTQTQFH